MLLTVEATLTLLPMTVLKQYVVLPTSGALCGQTAFNLHGTAEEGEPQKEKFLPSSALRTVQGTDQASPSAYPQD